MSLIRRDRRQWEPEPFIPPFPGFQMGGSTGAPSTMGAMQSSAVWACVRLLSSVVSMMPIQQFTLRNGIRVPVDTSPFFKMPAANTTMLDWVYMVMTSLALRGNAYGRVVARDSLLYPTQIELISPDTVKPQKDNATGLWSYTVNNAVVAGQDLFHARAFRFPGLDVGLSPIQQAAVTINRDSAINLFSLGYFQDAPHPASVLTSDQAISGDHAKVIKERLVASQNGREPLVLGAGLSFKPITVSPEESQFLLTQQYGAAEICRLFGVPPSKVPGSFVGDSMTYATIEGNNLDLLIYTIQWWLSNLEATLATLLPGNQHVRFDTSVLTRTDLETRLKATAIGIASHQMTPDEARSMGDLPPLTDAQKAELALVQMTVSPSGMPKALPAVPPAGDPTIPVNGVDLDPDGKGDS